ncbi:MAG: serine/threonine-protein kinase, partial [Thermoanaerobaculia bacterium]
MKVTEKDREAQGAAPPPRARSPVFNDEEFLRGLPCKDNSRIVGPVRIEARISKGGMGVVYRGHHLKLDIDVAVKFLLPHLAENNPEYVLRFEREARFAAQLNNENLVRVYDVNFEKNYHYVVMELVCGETARDRVARKGPLAEAEAMSIILGATRGLEAAHRKSIVHRDIKPENIMIDSSGVVKLADLGIAKAQSDPDRTQSLITQPGVIIGTPSYMAPEQVQSAHAVSPAVDIYSMGATLYFLLTTKPPYEGGLFQIIQAIGARGFPDIRELRPGLSENVVRILRRCTQLNPAARYPDASALLRDLERSGLERRSLAEADMGT